MLQRGGDDEVIIASTFQHFFSPVHNNSRLTLLPATSRHAAILLLALCMVGCGRRDDVLAADLRQRIADNPALRDTSMAVIVKKGIVLLRGHVAKTDQTREATATVSRVDGVQKVITQFTLRDDSIREGVAEAFQHDALLKDVPIDIDVVDGAVRLRSSATNAAQRSRAVAVAHALPGVVHVEDDMK